MFLSGHRLHAVYLLLRSSKCSVWMTWLQPSEGCGRGCFLLSHPTISGQPPQGCSSVPRAEAGGTSSLAPWWRGKTSALPRRTWGNTARSRMENTDNFKECHSYLPVYLACIHPALWKDFWGHSSVVIATGSSVWVKMSFISSLSNVKYLLIYKY